MITLNELSIGELSHLEFVVLQFLVTVDIDLSCHVSLEIFQR